LPLPFHVENWDNWHEDLHLPISSYCSLL
jgi:hypothetical protein